MPEFKVLYEKQQALYITFSRLVDVQAGTNLWSPIVWLDSCKLVVAVVWEPIGPAPYKAAKSAPHRG